LDISDWYQQHRCRCHWQSLFSGVVDTSDKFIANVVVTGDNCSAVSTTPVINLSPISTTPLMTENPWQRLIAGVVDTGDKFVSGVVDTAEQFIAGVVGTDDKLSFAIILVNFRKKSKWSWWYTQGPGVHWFMKKTEVENLLSDSRERGIARITSEAFLDVFVF